MRHTGDNPTVQMPVRNAIKSDSPQQALLPSLVKTAPTEAEAISDSSSSTPSPPVIAPSNPSSFFSWRNSSSKNVGDAVPSRASPRPVLHPATASNDRRASVSSVASSVSSTTTQSSQSSQSNSFREVMMGLRRNAPAARSASYNNRSTIIENRPLYRSRGGSWHLQVEPHSAEHTAQRLRALPRLMSYSSQQRLDALRGASYTDPPHPDDISLPPEDTSEYATTSEIETETEEEAELDGYPSHSPSDDDESQSSNIPEQIVPTANASASTPPLQDMRASWTTFAPITPLETVRPNPEREASTSYFDFRAHRSSESSTTPHTSRPPSRPLSRSRRNSFSGPSLPTPGASVTDDIIEPATLSQHTPPRGARLPRRRSSMYELRPDDLPTYVPPPRANSVQMDDILPREDEGREELPAYTCQVHIEGWMPRKVEFTSPGQQATSRVWKRQYIILHGTSLKICKLDPDEKAGKIKPPAATALRKPVDALKTSSNMSSRRSSFSSSRTSLSSQSNTDLHSAANSANNSRRNSLNFPTDLGAAQATFTTSPTQTKAEDDGTHTAALLNVALNSESVKNAGTRVMHVHEGHYDGARLSMSDSLAGKVLSRADKGDHVVRHYTLQGAESGLAADYPKRPHCIRVRAEGEQFLMQAADDRGVIDWIEALQAATNIALDLDSRPLPKFITLPRRRRRRRPADAAVEAVAAADRAERAARAEIEADQRANATTNVVS